MTELCTHGRSVWCPDCERERHPACPVCDIHNSEVLYREGNCLRPDCPHASSNVVAEDRCVNTIHSNYVTDHRCQLRSGHEGDCLFGRAIPNVEAKPPYQGESAYYRHLEQERKDAELGRATRNRAARVWVGIETYNWGEEIDHVRVFTGKDKAEQWRDEKPMVRGIEEAEVE